MSKFLMIVATIFVAGFVLFMIRQNAQDSRNRAAIQRTIDAGKGIRPGSNTQYRQNVGETPAGARHRQMQR